MTEFVIILVFIAILLGPIIYLLYSTIIVPIKHTAGVRKARARNIAWFNRNQNTLSIHKQHQDIRKELIIESEYNLPGVSHIEDQHVYTGTVIGGVAVGNVTTIKGGDYLVRGSKTDLLHLAYKYGELSADRQHLGELG